MEPTRDCLKLGGETTLADQQNDAKKHRVEPEDSDYEALLARAGCLVLVRSQILKKNHAAAQ